MSGVSSLGLISFPFYVSTPGNAEQALLFEIRTGPTDYCVINRVVLGALVTGAEGPGFGIGVPGARGSGVKVSYALQPESPWGISASGVTIALDWNVPPTIPSTFFRRIKSNSNAIVSAVPAVMQFPSGLKMLPSSSIVLWMTGIATSAGPPASAELLDIEVTV
jgi:hypothetical protein